MSCWRAFPVSHFSLAGVSKKNALGRARSFACRLRDVIFDVVRIIDARRARAVCAGNVKNLKSHDETLTFRIIMQRSMNWDMTWRMPLTMAN